LDSLKYLISKLVSQCPIEILIKSRTFLDNLFTEMKDLFDSYYAEKYSVKERNRTWENIVKKYANILQPLLDVINKETDCVPSPIIPEKKVNNSMILNHAIKEYQKTQIQRNWPNPFEIDFLKIEPNDVATISCKIGDLLVPHAIIDTGADSTLFSNNIPIYLGKKIDKKNACKLTGAIGVSQSIGTSYNIPITIGSGDDSITVLEEEVSIIPAKKDRNGNDISIVILGTKWQHRVGWDPIVKGEFTATHNGKTITIPLSVHKPQKNVFNTEKNQVTNLEELKKNV